MKEEKDKRGNKAAPASQTGLLQKLAKTLKLTLTYQEKRPGESFVLSGTNDTLGKKENHRSPQKTRKVLRRIPPVIPGKSGMEKGDYDWRKLRVDHQLAVNKTILEEIYSLPKNKDIIVRDFTIALDPPLQAFAIFVEGLSDKEIINNAVLKPLMILTRLEKEEKISDVASYLKKRILHGNEVEILDQYDGVLERVNYGGTAVFIEGIAKCLAIETKGWDKRAVGKPEVEQVIRGPHEAFNETLRSNTALVRKAIRSETLITEMFKVGARNKADLAIMYLQDLANSSLVEEVKRRITSIQTDFLGETGILEQFIEDHPFMPTPQMLSTERPDRVASFLIDGRVAILIDGNPNVLIVPITIFSLLHSAEDYYLRFPYGNLIRILRTIATFLAIMIPGVYVAITTFHQEMIPTDLVLAIAASRETVPFPTIFEVFLMEFAFELIREAGVRIPGIFGNTLGIVGALILGQAAVQAGIVSPILIIVVAVTGLSSLAISNYSMSFALRGIRFIFTALAAVMGIFGITTGLFILITSLSGMKSFGVPMLSPIGPRTISEPDIILRGPIWSMDQREDYLETKDRPRQPRISRGWIKPKGKKEKGGPNG